MSHHLIFDVVIFKPVADEFLIFSTPHLASSVYLHIFLALPDSSGSLSVYVSMTSSSDLYHFGVSSSSSSVLLFLPHTFDSHLLHPAKHSSGQYLRPSALDIEVIEL